MNITSFLNDIGLNLKDRVLVNPIFKQIADRHLKLNDTVFVYTDQKQWKIIPLSTAQVYPVIHDEFYETTSKPSPNLSKITIVICPFTLFSSVYFGEYEPTNKVFNNNITLIDKNNTDNLLIPITNSIYSLASGDITQQKIRKAEVRVMTLRNAISKYPDCMFIDESKFLSQNPEAVEGHNSKFDNLVPDNYNSSTEILFPHLPFDSYHPKTLIYIIEYISKKTGDYKLVVLLTKDVSPTSVNALDITKNGFDSYFNKMINKIRDRAGVIQNTYWFAWSGLHPNTKVIQL